MALILVTIDQQSGGKEGGEPSRARAREEAMEREKKRRGEIESRAVWWQRPWLCRCISITRLMTPWPHSRPSRISELRNLHTPTCAFPRLERGKKKKKKSSNVPLSRSTVPTCPAIRKRRQNTDENYKWTLLSRELALIYERVVKIISEPWLRIRFVNGFICSASCVGMEKRSK